MHWAAEGDEVHVDAGVCLVEEGKHQVEVVVAVLRDVDDAAVGSLSLEVSESAQEMIYERHDGSEVAQLSYRGL